MPGSSRAVQLTSELNFTVAGPPHFGSKVTVHAPSRSMSSRFTTGSPSRSPVHGLRNTTNDEPHGSKSRRTTVLPSLILKLGAARHSLVTGFHSSGSRPDTRKRHFADIAFVERFATKNISPPLPL